MVENLLSSCLSKKLNNQGGLSCSKPRLSVLKKVHMMCDGWTLNSSLVIHHTRDFIVKCKYWPYGMVRMVFMVLTVAILFRPEGNPMKTVDHERDVLLTLTGMCWLLSPQCWPVNKLQTLEETLLYFHFPQDVTNIWWGEHPGGKVKFSEKKKKMATLK